MEQNYIFTIRKFSKLGLFLCDRGGEYVVCETNWSLT